MSRILCLGDIHGEYEKLIKVLERANVTEEDLVISLGDIVDRGPDPIRCMQVLNDLKHRKLLKGNHDQNFQAWIGTGFDSFAGHHGARGTQEVYKKASSQAKEFVRRFLAEQIISYVDRFNNCYVHGGLNPTVELDKQMPSTLMWDRQLWERVLELKAQYVTHLETADEFNKIFIGHTPTIIWNETIPMKACNVINVDTGSGKGGKLTIMDVETEQYWQSD